MALQIVPPRVQFSDQNGMISREWYRYMQQVFEQIGGESGLVPVSRGGTGLSGGTSGGIPYYDSASSMASSGLLGENEIVFGGGSGGAPSTPLTSGTAKRVLLSGSSGNLPQWTNYTVPTGSNQGDLLYSYTVNAFGLLPKDETATRYLSNTGTSNNPAWAQVNLADGVTGDLPYSNLAQGTALSVLGVAGNATADVASIVAASDYQVLRRSGTAVAFGAVDISQSAAVTGLLPMANLNSDIFAFAAAYG